MATNIDETNFRDVAKTTIDKYQGKGMILDALVWGAIVGRYEKALTAQQVQPTCAHGVRWPHECKDCETEPVKPEEMDDAYLLRAHIETQRNVLRQVLAVLDAGADFQCGPKGKHLLLREQIRALASGRP